MTNGFLGYLDAGSASMILQMVGGGIAALAVTFKLFWRRILRFLRLERDEEPPAAPRADGP